MLFSLPPAEHLGFLRRLPIHTSVISWNLFVPDFMHYTRKALVSCINENLQPLHLIVKRFKQFHLRSLLQGIEDQVVVYAPPDNNKSRDWNWACKDAFGSGHSWALFVDNDVEVMPGSAYALMSAMQKVRGPRLLFAHNLLTGRSNMVFSTFAISREMYELVGEFDEDIPLGGNDWFYLQRMYLKGVRPTYCPGYKVRHRDSMTLSRLRSGSLKSDIFSVTPEIGFPKFTERFGVERPESEYDTI